MISATAARISGNATSDGSKTRTATRMIAAKNTYIPMPTRATRA
jgi:hypothetical protein